MDFTSIITAGIGMIGGGGLIKLATMYTNFKKESRQDDPELVLRAFLKEQVEILTSKQDKMFVKIELLIIENAELKVQLAEANEHIESLSIQIKSKFR